MFFASGSVSCVVGHLQQVLNSTRNFVRYYFFTCILNIGFYIILCFDVIWNISILFYIVI